MPSFSLTIEIYCQLRIGGIHTCTVQLYTSITFSDANSINEVSYVRQESTTANVFLHSQPVKFILAWSTT